MPNDLEHVRRVMERRETQGVMTWLLGGWAEQLHGLIEARAHRDVDLLFRGDDFAPVDRFLGRPEVEEVVAERFPHKRAFVVDGVLTELILVRPDPTTMFWNRQCFAWPADVFSSEDGQIRLALVDAPAADRRTHVQLRRPDEHKTNRLPPSSRSISNEHEGLTAKILRPSG